DAVYPIAGSASSISRRARSPRGEKTTTRLPVSRWAQRRARMRSRIAAPSALAGADQPARPQRVAEPDAALAGQVVVADAGGAQRGVGRTGAAPRAGG